MVLCSSYISIALMKHHELKQLVQEGRGLWRFTVASPAWREVRAEIPSGNLEIELKQRLSCFGFPAASSARFLIHTA